MKNLTSLTNYYRTLSIQKNSVRQGPDFAPKIIFIPSPFLKIIFSPSGDLSFYGSYRTLFALILPYFAFILHFYFLFSLFLPTFFLFLSPFFLFPLILSPFFSSSFHIFPQNDTGWYSPRGGCGGYFPISRPMQWGKEWLLPVGLLVVKACLPLWM